MSTTTTTDRARRPVRRLASVRDRLAGADSPVGRAWCVNTAPLTSTDGLPLWCWYEDAGAQSRLRCEWDVVAWDDARVTVRGALDPHRRLMIGAAGRGLLAATTAADAPQLEQWLQRETRNRVHLPAGSVADTVRFGQGERVLVVHTWVGDEHLLSIRSMAAQARLERPPQPVVLGPTWSPMPGPGPGLFQKSGWPAWVQQWQRTFAGLRSGGEAGGKVGSEWDVVSWDAGRVSVRGPLDPDRVIWIGEAGRGLLTATTAADAPDVGAWMRCTSRDRVHLPVAAGLDLKVNFVRGERVLVRHTWAGEEHLLSIRSMAAQARLDRPPHSATPGTQPVSMEPVAGVLEASGWSVWLQHWLDAFAVAPPGGAVGWQ